MDASDDLCPAEICKWSLHGEEKRILDLSFKTLAVCLTIKTKDFEMQHCYIQEWINTLRLRTSFRQHKYRAIILKKKIKHAFKDEYMSLD